VRLRPHVPFVPSGDDRPAIVWAVGDGADGGPAARAVAARISGRADRLLYLGDVYAEGTAQEFATNYQSTYGGLRHLTAPTPGNHEWPNRRVGYGPYWTEARGQPPPPYYAFELAGWQILSLNSEEPCAPGSAQHRWLSAMVREPGTARIAFWHRARFSAGKHGDQPDTSPLWEALRGRASIVLCAHDHNMQRLKPIDGMTQFVSGAGGRSRYRLERSWRRVLPRRYSRSHRDPRLDFANDTDYGALRLELEPGIARFGFIAVDGRVLDAGSLACQPLRRSSARSGCAPDLAPEGLRG